MSVCLSLWDGSCHEWYTHGSCQLGSDADAELLDFACRPWAQPGFQKTDSVTKGFQPLVPSECVCAATLSTLSLFPGWLTASPCDGFLIVTVGPSLAMTELWLPQHHAYCLSRTLYHLIFIWLLVVSVFYTEQYAPQREKLCLSDSLLCPRDGSQCQIRCNKCLLCFSYYQVLYLG